MEALTKSGLLLILYFISFKMDVLLVLVIIARGGVVRPSLPFRRGRVLWVAISVLFAVFVMGPYPTYEQRSFKSSFPRPSFASERGEDLDPDHRPILEREHDDNGPPPIRAPRHRVGSSAPPSSPTSRGTPLDEPLWTQNARSSADLWLRGWWIEQRLDIKLAPTDACTVHNPYRDMMFDPAPYWEDEYETRGTLTRSYQSSNQSAPDDDSATGIISLRRRRESSTCSSLTFRSTGDDQLSIQHRKCGTEKPSGLDDNRSPAKEGDPSSEFGNPDYTTASATFNAGTKARHACYVERRNNTERAIEICSHGLNDPPPSHDLLNPDTPWTVACESDSSGRGFSLRTTAQIEPMIPERSVFEDDEREGRWARFAAFFHRHPSRRSGRVARRRRFRTSMSKLFKCLSCCRSIEEN